MAPAPAPVPRLPRTPKAAAALAGRPQAGRGASGSAELGRAEAGSGAGRALPGCAYCAAADGLAARSACRPAECSRARSLGATGTREIVLGQCLPFHRSQVTSTRRHMLVKSQKHRKTSHWAIAEHGRHGRMAAAPHHVLLRRGRLPVCTCTIRRAAERPRPAAAARRSTGSGVSGSAGSSSGSGGAEAHSEVRHQAGAGNVARLNFQRQRLGLGQQPLKLVGQRRQALGVNGLEQRRQLRLQSISSDATIY